MKRIVSSLVSCLKSTLHPDQHLLKSSLVVSMKRPLRRPAAQKTDVHAGLVAPISSVPECRDYVRRIVATLVPDKHVDIAFHGMSNDQQNYDRFYCVSCSGGCDWKGAAVYTPSTGAIRIRATDVSRHTFFPHMSMCSCFDRI